MDNTDAGFTANPAVPGHGLAGRSPACGYNGSNAYMAVLDHRRRDAPTRPPGRPPCPRRASMTCTPIFPRYNNSNPETPAPATPSPPAAATSLSRWTRRALTNAGESCKTATTPGRVGAPGPLHTSAPCASVSLSDLTNDSGKNVWFDAMMWIPEPGPRPRPPAPAARAPTNTPTRTPTRTPTTRRPIRPKARPTGTPLTPTATWTPTATPT